MAILLCKQISFYSFENKITSKVFIYKSYSYIYLNLGKQMIDVKFLTVT